MRAIDGGDVIVRDAGQRQKLSPTSPSQPLYSATDFQARQEPRRVMCEPFLLAQFPMVEDVFRDSKAQQFDGRPIVDVSWLDAVRFCNVISEEEGFQSAYSFRDDEILWDMAANGYRLPTEAEWQLAAASDSAEDGWFSQQSPQPVGLKPANAFGVHDMLGNVWEWCWDLFDPAVYGAYRVFRGGGFADVSSAISATTRRKSHPNFRMDDLGFRLARNSRE